MMMMMPLNTLVYHVKLMLQEREGRGDLQGCVQLQQGARHLQGGKNEAERENGGSMGMERAGPALIHPATPV